MLIRATISILFLATKFENQLRKSIINDDFLYPGFIILYYCLCDLIPTAGQLIIMIIITEDSQENATPIQSMIGNHSSREESKHSVNSNIRHTFIDDDDSSITSVSPPSTKFDETLLKHQSSDYSSLIFYHQ